MNKAGTQLQPSIPFVSMVCLLSCKSVLLLSLLSLFQAWGFAQQYPTGYFGLPLPQITRVSGTFAEFRYDHFHSGIDFPAPMRTPVYAIADGYISRIRLQSAGFGRALYINHPNGYTSVYAHLDEFIPDYEHFVTNYQFTYHTFELDEYPDTLRFPVKKGQIVAYSGNSGSSQGPHLHFEIRQTAGEMPTNPLLFGLKVNDNRKPVIRSLSYYRVRKNGDLLTGSMPVSLPVLKTAAGFSLKQTAVVNLPPYVIFGIRAQDIDGSGNKNGLYELTVRMDSVLVYHTGMDQFSFDHFRAINSLIDYDHYQKTRQFVQLTRVAPCNAIPLYKTALNGGVFDFSDGQVHRITIELSDYQGNLTELSFRAQCKDPAQYPCPPRNSKHDIVFPCDQSNDFVSDELKLHIPRGVLFDTLELDYSKQSAAAGFYSSVHKIQDGSTPLNDYMVVSVRAKGLPAAYQDKACLARPTAKGGKTYIGGRYENGWVTALTRKFGSFAIAVDATPPVIKAVIRKDKKGRVLHPDRLTFKISDNFSGIGNYCGYVDGQWVLMVYDHKKSTLTYRIDSNLSAGEHLFELFVTDRIGNQQVFSRTIRR
ncbi:MAG TPA: M23 family metallopeptidase [Bacteroidales bacterium]|nr:M23 family metallopeptidase [Bacteroidales bacterium]HSA42731.1 M23 family metallopeptidase [Bacteroidales bacterium]